MSDDKFTMLCVTVGICVVAICVTVYQIVLVFHK